jgi:hypothetical protein
MIKSNSNMHSIVFIFLIEVLPLITCFNTTKDFIDNTTQGIITKECKKDLRFDECVDQLKTASEELTKEDNKINAKTACCHFWDFMQCYKKVSDQAQCSENGRKEMESIAKKKFPVIETLCSEYPEGSWSCKSWTYLLVLIIGVIIIMILISTIVCCILCLVIPDAKNPDNKSLSKSEKNYGKKSLKKLSIPDANHSEENSLPKSGKNSENNSLKKKSSIPDEKNSDENSLPKSEIPDVKNSDENCLPKSSKT